MTAAEHVDVLIVGAGLSGVGAAARLQRERPGTTFALLESRGAVGGTWDLFRYPGVRSDSDMFTLGYSFRPWRGAQAIASGGSIRQYLLDAITDEGLLPRIRLHTRVRSATWSSAEANWTVTALRTGDGEAASGDAGETVTLSCSFLWLCTGYYRYDEGYTPPIPGIESFAGPVMHPQHWPAEFDAAGKHIVVIGSGATAVSLVPALAETADHVTMLQRSPGYIAAVASTDRFANAMRRVLPAAPASALVRAKNIAFSTATYQLSRRRPGIMKAILRTRAIAELPAGFDVDTHLAPAYDPWDQRLCAAPDADIFRAITRGGVDMVTGRIESITPTGILLESGATITADAIVTATGLNLLALGGLDLTVDGRPVDAANRVTYKGLMLDGVPNLALTIGYTNASWTLRADLVARYVCRMLRYMERHGHASVTPVAPAAVRSDAGAPLLDLQAGYVLRGIAQLPKQGRKAPWRVRQNYPRDFARLRLGRVTDDVRYGGSQKPLPRPGKNASRGQDPCR